MNLSIKEAVSYLDVSRATVSRRIRAGELSAQKADGQWRVLIEDETPPPELAEEESEQSTLVEVLREQLLAKDVQIEQLHQMLMQTALAASPPVEPVPPPPPPPTPPSPTAVAKRPPW